jgi:aspartate aminotransferase
VSKAYAMTGWRIGYAGGPVALIKAMGTIQSQSTSNPCSVSQYAALEALTGPQDFLALNRKLFQRRRDLVVSMLNQAKGIRCPKPEGRLLRLPRHLRLHRQGDARGTVITNDEVFATRPAGGNRRRRGLRRGLRAVAELPRQLRYGDEVLREACSRIQRFCAALV